MNTQELEYKIERIQKFILQNKYTLEEFNEMEGYLKEYQPSWEGCASCQGKISFGKVLLQNILDNLIQQRDQITPIISNSDEVIPYEDPLPVAPIPQGKVKIKTTCNRCKNKNR